MAETNICLGLSARGYLSSSGASMEDDYQELLKPFFSFLYANPSVLFAFSFSSRLFSFLEKNHPESLEILRELYVRRQLEFMGSAYHDPMLPLLFPTDRTSQIEKMNSMIRSLLGKRPRGMVLPGSMWDYSLVTSLCSCGMEYVVLDSTLVPSSSRSFYPLITGGMGKSLKVLCVHSALAPDFDGGEEPAAWLSRIQKAVSKSPAVNGSTGGNDSPVVAVTFDLPAFRKFFTSPFFAYVMGYFTDRDDGKYQGIRFTLPQLYLKSAKTFIPAYIPAGMNWSMARWSRKPFESCENRSRFPLTVYDYLNCYKSSGCLYDRMMYISMILAQGHGGDKIQKKLAKEKLWEAQCIANYVSLPSGLPASSERRQEAFRLLNEAELIIRQTGPQRASIVSYDYNRDGLSEYVCSMRNLRLVITRLAAQIVELDNISKGCNYASSLSRIAVFDGKNDGYTRGFFTDHFFASGAIDGYSISLDAGTDVFSKILFDEKKLDSRRNEILLSSRVCLPGSHTPVELLKRYTVLDDGLSIQYILRNDGDEPLRGTFVVESNFAQTCFSKKAGFQYSCELVLDGETRVLDTQSPFRSDGHVSALRITDQHDKMQFNFEPNEEAGFIADTIVFRRPDAYNSIGEDSRTLVTSFFWNVDLPSGMSVEKNINFSVTSVRSRKKAASPSL